MGKKKILEIKNLSKIFPGVKALNNINFNVYENRAMGLVGENGAGKSTIINIIGGILKKDEGEIYFKGKKTDFKNIKDSKKSGISIVHQELQLVDNLTILENIFLGSEIKNKYGLFDWKTMRKKTIEVLKKLHINLDPSIIVDNLSIGMKQMIEIARALSFNSKLIIMDEPTSSLSGKESKELFKVIKQLKKDKISIVYVSHRMEELKIVCDDITIFRDGESINESELKDMDENLIIENMIGRKIKDQYARDKIKRKNIIFEAKNISNKFVQNISFKSYEGEVLGFFGLIGAGRTELFKSLIGLYKYSGDIYYLNKKSKFKSPGAAIKKGLYYLTEDRKNEGLILDFSIKVNTSLSSLSSMYYKKIPIISQKKEKVMSANINKNLQTKMISINQKCQNLSGGNQQKVAIAKVLMTFPKLFILDEPTRGIDVGAKKEIYLLIQKLKKAGAAIIVISSDLSEIIGITDRVILMAEGKYISEHNSWNTSASTIMDNIIFQKKERIENEFKE